jgi:hypothetical protein
LFERTSVTKPDLPAKVLFHASDLALYRKMRTLVIVAALVRATVLGALIAMAGLALRASAMTRNRLLALVRADTAAFRWSVTVQAYG